MTTNNTQDSNAIGSLDELSHLLAGFEANAEATIETGLAPEVVETSPAAESISINSAPVAAERLPVQATVDVMPNDDILAPVYATEEVTPAAQIPEVPTLQATLEADAVRDKDDGKFEEVKDALLSVLRQMHADVQANAVNKGSRVSQVLNAAVIDPNNIEIAPSSNDPMSIHTQLRIIAAANPEITFPVIALKSGYKADMLALSNADKIDVRNLKGSVLDQTSKMLRIIYNKIQDTTVGKISYDEFLNLTAEDDYETLLFGIFTATFPNATEYNLNCPHCKQQNNLSIYPGQLIEVIDKERAGKYVQEVLGGYNRGREFLANSLVAKSERKLLPTSKIIIEVATPTLRNMLANLMTVERLKNHNGELLAITKHISKMYIPDVNAMAQGRVIYHEITSKDDILPILVKLPAADMTATRAAISERVRQYHIEYRIPDFNCASSTCSKPITNVGIDMMNLIFLGIAEEL
jgi:hypothetical protein